MLSKDTSTQPNKNDSEHSSPVDDSAELRDSSKPTSPAENEEADIAEEESTEIPPLPDEAAPPLPDEAPPTEEDGWAPLWEERAQAFYFFNRFTNVSQWENPRLPQNAESGPPGLGSTSRAENTAADKTSGSIVTGGYDPAIHGDYDPNAYYAKAHELAVRHDQTPSAPSTDPARMYAATGAFNRFTGKWQNAELAPENFNDENKSRRQMNAFFDVDAAANSHDGKSLKAERSGKKLSKQELKAFKEKRKERKEEKRRAWLRD